MANQLKSKSSIDQNRLVNLNSEVLKNLDNLKDREKEILSIRFGLIGDNPKTLQSIGKQFSITRERVRQIINHCFKKLKKSPNQSLLQSSQKIEANIKKNGGLIPEQNLSYRIVPYDLAQKNLGAIEIICRINPNLTKLKKTPKTQNFWSVTNINLRNILKINQILTEILKTINKTQTSTELAKRYQQKTNQPILEQKIISIALGSHNLIVTPQNNIGLTEWPQINPKNTKDKIFYILNQAKKPLHFSEIQQKISEKKFATKNPTQTTVHNELISDDRFVLVGRGIYALKEWGFKKGTVLDLLKKILKKEKSGLNQEKICQQILKKRLISKNTIIMNLHSSNIFVKDNKDNWKIKRN